MKLPLVLAFAVATTGAITAIVTSCGGDDAPVCQLHCEVGLRAPTFNDAGVEIDAAPVTCPDCADPVTFACPSGCDPVG